MTTFTAPLPVLRFGHEATPPVNARRTGRCDGIDALASSILAHGLIQALTVRRIDGAVYVVDGNRRLAALRHLVKQKKLATGTEIRCEGREGSAGAEEISLAANICRAPLHPADQYEAFRDLVAGGLEEGEIAARFGIEPWRVKRMLALGRLSPVILDAWRKGDLGDRPVDTVRAFTMAPSPEAQERVFRELAAGGKLWPHFVRKQFGAGDQQSSRLMTFIGVDAYVAAGGAVVEDLFGDDHAISDPMLAARLAEAKLAEAKAAVAKEGWGWVEVEADLPSGWSWNWQKLGLTKRAKKDQKATSGAVVRLDHEGHLDIVYGVVKPAAPPRSAKTTSESEGPATISAAMAHRLSVSATIATRTALAEEPRLGLVALLAGFLSRPHDFKKPIKVQHQGLGHQAAAADGPDFWGAFEAIQAKSDAELFHLAAEVAGQAVSLESQSTAAVPFDGGAGMLAAALDPERMEVALRAAFDAEDYFQSIARPFVLTAIAEAVNADAAKTAGKLKKAEMVAFALANVPATGWLPPELRTANYAGPGAAQTVQEAAE